MIPMILTLCVLQGLLGGALVSYLEEGVPRWVYWGLGVNAGVICGAFLSIDWLPGALAFAAQCGAAFSFLSSRPPGAAA